MSFLSQLNGFDAASLDLLQRILLINDGTLTDALEVAFLEPIELVKIAVDTSPTSEAIPELLLEPGSPLMRRRILLRGEASRTNYVFAESLIALDRLDPEFRTGLENTTNPIGRLWTEHRLETWKEILRVWRCPEGALREHFGDSPGGLLARCYRVFSSARPIMLISEYFPFHSVRAPR
jgi:chorismate-pyruvate lyase